MSKSLGNYFTLEDIVKKWSPELVRYMFISTHYRKKLDYTDKFAENAKRNYEKLKETFDRINFFLKSADTKKTKFDDKFLKKLPKIKKKFIEAMDDDFNTPLALRVFHELSKEINKYLEKGKNKNVLNKVLKLFKEFSEVFGLKFKEEKKKLPIKIEKLIIEREKARKRKDWKKADAIRDKLRKMGILLEDTPEGVKWKIVKKLK